MTNKIKLIISLLLPQLAGGFGAFFMGNSVSTWYQVLEKPFFNPPSWVFGPVWLTLYLLMGISAYLIWKRTRENKEIKNTMNIYWAHLALNATWTPIFFGLQNIALAFFAIVALWILILILIVKFWRINKIASYLLMPYIAWVTIATALNASIWYLN
jgi:translocator protein